MCFREAESVIFRSVGPMMIEITRDLSFSQTPPLYRVAITVFHDDFSSSHDTLMKIFRKRCLDFKKMLKVFDCFQILISGFLFPVERLLLPARGTVFY